MAKKKTTKKPKPDPRKKGPKTKFPPPSGSLLCKKTDPYQLNMREEKFVEEYVITSNATLSAKRAGYSPRSAHVHGCLMLKRFNVSQAIAKRRAIERTRLEASGRVTREYLIEKLLALLELDPHEYGTWSGGSFTAKPSSEIPPAVRKLLDSVQPGPGGVGVKITTTARTKAIELLSKLLGYDVQKHEITGPNQAPIQIYLPDNQREPHLARTALPAKPDVEAEDGMDGYVPDTPLVDMPEPEDQ